MFKMLVKLMGLLAIIYSISIVNRLNRDTENYNFLKLGCTTTFVNTDFRDDMMIRQIYGIQLTDNPNITNTCMSIGTYYEEGWIIDCYRAPDQISCHIPLKLPQISHPYMSVPIPTSYHHLLRFRLMVTVILASYLSTTYCLYNHNI